MTTIILIELAGLTSAQIFENDPEGARDEVEFWQQQGAHVQVVQALESTEVMQ